MKKTPKFTLFMVALLVLLLMGLTGCYPVRTGGNVQVSSQCTGICDGNVPSSFNNIPVRSSGGSSQHKLPGYRQGATVFVPQNVSKAGAIVFCPPMTGVQIMYKAWGPYFASQGIILVTIDTTTTFDPVDTRAGEHMAAVNALKNDPGVSGILDTSRIGVCGWSMGGGSTWINASKNNSGLKTAMSFAGHNMTAMNKGYGIKIPVVLFNGATDYTLLGGLGQSEGVYNAVANGVPKIIYVVAMSGHMNWGSPTAGGVDVARVALAFQKTFLHDDGRWAQFLTHRPSGASTWATNISVN